MSSRRSTRRRTTRPPLRSTSSAPTPPGRPAQSPARPATARCSASTPPSSSTERVYGKPGDAEEAVEMLEALGGRTHEVVSGLCLVTPGWEEVADETTRVTFRPLTPRDIAMYVSAEEWEGRAGGLRYPGPRRRPGRAHRGRLPERGGSAGRALRPPACRAFLGRVRLRVVGNSPLRLIRSMSLWSYYERLRRP